MSNIEKLRNVISVLRVHLEDEEDIDVHDLLHENQLCGLCYEKDEECECPRCGRCYRSFEPEELDEVCDYCKESDEEEEEDEEDDDDDDAAEMEDDEILKSA